MPFNAQALRDAKQGGGEAPPDGLYDAELIDSKVLTDRHGRSWLLLSWKVLSGAQRDEFWESWHTTDQYDKQGEPNPGLGFTLGNLTALGVDLMQVEDDVDLSRATRVLHGHGYEVSVKRNGAFVNTDVTRELVNAAPSLPGTGYGQPPQTNDASSTSSGSIADAARSAREPERTGESDVTSAADTAAFDRSTAPRQGDIDPETGEAFPF